MLVLTGDLCDEGLDWAVSKSEGYALNSDGISLLLERGKEICVLGKNTSPLAYSPSSDPARAWPIIERENIWTKPGQAFMVGEQGEYLFISKGPTTLVAAMRCFVSSRMGQAVYVPEIVIRRMKHQMPAAPEHTRLTYDRQRTRGG